MPSLKDLRTRIKSVKATQKITSAMKMVAAAKLRRAQEKVIASRPFSKAMSRLLGDLLLQQDQLEHPPLLLTGREDINDHLVVVVTSDRGLCGGFNGAIARETRSLIRSLESQGIPVKLLCIGRKGRELLRRDHSSKILETLTDIGKKGLKFSEALSIARLLNDYLEKGSISKATIIYSTFKSALTQTVTREQLIPYIPEETSQEEIGKSLYEYEPDQQILLKEILPRNLAVQLYQVILETIASEQGARMTAMDNATRNARDVIKRLELNYNRTRQSVITKELIEIISGAEAL
jgi:F-type H+-transporting ATPase subunit gamma